jgi:4-diphosphocytidyl-2-C-methyl-D-erythritol kinase
MASAPPAAAEVCEAAPAKLNLALHVRRRRADGYHDLETIFAFARDGDRVTVAPADATTLTISGPFAADLRAPPPVRAPAPIRPPDNLVLRAESAFRAAFGVAAHHALHLDKHLPIASGIGGGSADAAATLRALADLHGVARDDPRLFAVAAALGADVPACLLGEAALGRGRGDALEVLPPLGDLPALLVNPGVAVPTGPVFARWDGVDRGPLALVGDALERARPAGNDLTAPALELAPAIGAVLLRLADAPGSHFVRMSGSGATCLALFHTAAHVHACAAAFAAEEPGWWCLETALR